MLTAQSASKSTSLNGAIVDALYYLYTIILISNDIIQIEIFPIVEKSIQTVFQSQNLWLQLQMICQLCDLDCHPVDTAVAKRLLSDSRYLGVGPDS